MANLRKIPNGVDSMQASTQIDPVARLTSEPDNLVKSLIETTRFFSSQDAVKAISQICDNAKNLRLEVDNRQNEISYLKKATETLEAEHQAELDLEKTIHEKAYQGILSAHESKISTVEREKITLQETLTTTEKELAAMKMNEAQLQQQTRDIKSAHKSISEKLKSEMEKVQAHKEEKKKLVQDAEATRKAVSELQSQLEKEEQRTLRLEKKLKEVEKENLATIEMLHNAQDTLSKWNGYLGEIHDKKADEILHPFTALCNSIRDAVFSLFDQDLSSEILAHPRALSNFRKALGLPGDFPLPRSNTRASKDARALAVIVFLARHMNRNVFSMMHCMGNDFQLRAALLRQTVIDQEKEEICRALLLNILQDEQLESLEYQTSEIIHETISAIQTVMSPSLADSFGRTLSPLIHNMAQMWWEAQRCKEKVEANTEAGTLDKLDWKTLELPGHSDFRDGAQVEEGDSISAVMFPEVFLMVRDECKRLFDGLVLRKWQLQSARDEVAETEGLNPTKPQAFPVRSRSAVKQRRLSMSADVARSQAAGPQSFLEGKA